MQKIYLVCAIALCMVLTSCHTTQKFNVEGTAGTEIYTPGMQRLGVIGTDGTAKLIISSDEYYTYLLAKKPQSNLLVPFALDYEKKSHTGARLLESAGVMVTLYGAIVGIVGVALSGNSGDNSGGALAAIGLGAAVGGATAWGVTHSRLKQKSYEYQFAYLKNQHANTDLQFTQPVFTESYKHVDGQNQVAQTVTTQTTQATPTPATETSSKSTKHLTQKSSKTLRDYGQQTEGTYTGTGSLTKGSETIETYTGIVVKIVRVSKDVVSVNVVESNGSEFFENAAKYNITKNQNGEFVLTNADISSATITIDQNGNLKYTHPKVNIDGDVYTLKISAK